MESKQVRPSVGVGVMLFNDQGELLLGKRINSHGSNTWACPGGHLEGFESLEDCAKRELIEETNLIGSNFILGPVHNILFEEENKHYLNVFMLSNSYEGVLTNKEPHKCSGWQWFSTEDLPSPMFLPLERFLQSSSFYCLYQKLINKPKVAYLASPYNHEDDSVKTMRLETVTKVAAQLHKAGHFVFSPLTHNIPLIENGITQNWQTWQSYDLTMLGKCDALYVLKLPGYQESLGVQAEIQEAKKLRMPIIELDYCIKTQQLLFPLEKGSLNDLLENLKGAKSFA